MSATIDLHTTIPIAEGVAMPLFGLGAFKMSDDETGYRAIRHALDLGYRHIDTASVYKNEQTVGRAIAESGIPREELFVTSKCWLNEMGDGATHAALAGSLKRLGLDHLDLYLVHWPDDTTLPDCWRAMRARRDAGDTRAIGICNFTVPRLQNFLAWCEETPAMHQYETHVLNQKPELAALCAEHGIGITAYSPLARAMRLDDPTLGAIATKHGKSPAQVMIRWCLQRGMATIPKSADPDRLRSNAAVFDFALDDEDLERLVACDQGFTVSDWVPDPDNWY